MILKIKKINNNAIIPNYAHDGDAGLDLKSCEEHLLEPGEKAIIKTGIAMEIPNGYVGLIWDRSGIAAKNAVHILAGVIDSCYRGEIGIVIVNLGKEKYKIEKGDKIAQILIQPVVKIEVEEVKEISKTLRDSGAWGSTGR